MIEGRTGEGLGWMTELEYAKEAWLKRKEKMREKKGNEGGKKGGRKGEKRWRRGGWRLSLDVDRKEGDEKREKRKGKREGENGGRKGGNECLLERKKWRSGGRVV